MAAVRNDPGERVCDPQEYRPHQTAHMIYGHRPQRLAVNRKSYTVNLVKLVSCVKNSMVGFRRITAVFDNNFLN
jgi:hypothetical protein